VVCPVVHQVSAAVASRYICRATNPKSNIATRVDMAIVLRRLKILEAQKYTITVTSEITISTTSSFIPCYSNTFSVQYRRKILVTVSWHLELGL